MKKGKKKWVYYFLFAVLLCVFLGSGGLLLKKLSEDYRQKKTYDELAERFTENTEESDAAETERNAVYEALLEENPDFVGWIRIPDTRIDYPVVQSPGRPDYYLHRDFYGKESSFGTIYLSEDCTIGDSTRGLLLFGHHMKNGEMFAALKNYTDQKFWETHRGVYFDTLDESGIYEVAAVVKLSAGDQSMPWQQLIFPENPQERRDAWDVFEKQRFYDTGIRLEDTDELLCLVTCEYSLQDGRLMVVARKSTGKS